MYQEWLRLTKLHGIRSARAKELIADAFSTEIRQVERAMKRQRDVIAERAKMSCFGSMTAYLKNYEHGLKIRKLLP